jgi:hypothetical protein
MQATLAAAHEHDAPRRSANQCRTGRAGPQAVFRETTMDPLIILAFSAATITPPLELDLALDATAQSASRGAPAVTSVDATSVNQRQFGIVNDQFIAIGPTNAGRASAVRVVRIEQSQGGAMNRQKLSIGTSND